jgi:hypothetical protein
MLGACRRPQAASGMQPRAAPARQTVRSAGMSPRRDGRSTARRSIALIVRQAGQRTHRNRKRAAMTAPMVGEKWRWLAEASV